MRRVTDRTVIGLVVGLAVLAGWPGLARPAPATPDKPAPPPATTPARPAAPGPAATIEITVDPLFEEAGGSATTMVLVRVKDSSGRLIDVTPRLEATHVKLGRPAWVERGVFGALLMVPQGPRTEVVEITARADLAVARARFSIAPVPATVRVEPPAPLRLDGSDHGQFAVLNVRVVDGAGRPRRDTPRGSGGRGKFGEALGVGPGQWVLLYRPPWISEDTTEEVVVTAGEVSTTVTLEFLARRFSLAGGLKAGVAAAAGGQGPAVGAEVGAWRRVGRGQIGLVLDLSWWMLSSSSTVTVGATDLAYHATQHDPSLLLSAAWRSRLGDRWMLWATVGGGAGMVANSATVGGQPPVKESGVVPAASGSLSVTPRLGKGAFFLEARATWFGAPDLATLSGSTTTLLALLGYRLDVD